MESEAQDAVDVVPESITERNRSLASLVRECIEAWDPGSVVRSAIRPDGLLDLTVVSHRFEGLGSREREAAFWPALDGVPQSEMLYLTYCLLVTPNEALNGICEIPVGGVGAIDNWQD